MKVEQILLSEFIFCQLPRKQKDLQKFNFIIRDNKSILYIQFVKRKQGALVPARLPYLPAIAFLLQTTKINHGGSRHTNQSKSALFCTRKEFPFHAGITSQFTHIISNHRIESFNFEI